MIAARERCPGFNLLASLLRSGLAAGGGFFLNLIDTIMKNEITIQAGNGMLTAFRDLDQMLLVADKLAGSTIVPRAYQKQPGNVLVALNTAQRLRIDPLMVMQNLYVVYGNPGWSGQFALALLNNCNKYSRLEYVNVNGQDWHGGLKMVGHKWDGTVDEGPEITPELVSKAGWDKKDGSKWLEMPEQMFRYRAASWFAKSCCPEVLLGLPTADELRDEGPREVREVKSTVVESDAATAAPVAGLGVRRGAAAAMAAAKPRVPETENAIGLPPLSDAERVKAGLRSSGVKWDVFTKWLEGRSVKVPAGRDELEKFCGWLVSQDGLLADAEQELGIKL